MRRLPFLALPAAAAAIAAIVLLPGAGSAQQTGGEQTFKLVEAGTGPSKFIDIPPRVTRKRGPGAGDGFTFTHKVTDSSGNPAGTLTAICTVTATKTTLLCDGVFKLQNGTITGSGLTPENSLTTTIAVTGGTGAYEGARGTITAVARSHADNSPSDDTIHLLG